MSTTSAEAKRQLTAVVVNKKRIQENKHKESRTVEL